MTVVCVLVIIFVLEIEVACSSFSPQPIINRIENAITPSFFAKVAVFICIILLLVKPHINGDVENTIKENWLLAISCG